MKEDRHINDEAKKAFEEAKAYFSGFKDIDWIMPDQIKIVDNALPNIGQEEADKRIEAAMHRIYDEKPDPIKPGLENESFTVKINNEEFGGPLLESKVVKRCPDNFK